MNEFASARLTLHRAVPLSGLTALVTGGGRGIGRATALACADAGANVIAVSRTRSDLESLQLEAREAAGSLSALVFDVTSQDFIQAIARIERLDVLVNNAGTNKLQELADVDDATLDLLLNLNVRSAFQVSRAAALRMIVLGIRGSIIHVSSQMGHVGAAKRSVYCMTKHAMEGLTKAMAIELAPKQIRVNSVAPTFVETSMTTPYLANPAYRAFAIATVPLMRIATAADVAEAVVYLASPAARMVTGTSLRVDGGATAQ
jgi:NAD(P)-dependent dehydrogenase (short-subunit alcohol dehydrogenase family)